MTDVYEKCPVLENGKYLLRFVEESDADDLLEVYGDKNALPFFNSDNCHGDIFYYPTRERMLEAIRFWIESYSGRWFVRLTVIDKTANKAIGTVEMFLRPSNDAFDGAALLRIDLGSGYERKEVISELVTLIVPAMYDIFGCGCVITKAPAYAVERASALSECGFERSVSPLIGGEDGIAYYGYMTAFKS